MSRQELEVMFGIDDLKKNSFYSGINGRSRNSLIFYLPSTRHIRPFATALLLIKNVGFPAFRFKN
ncbi:MAG: hypothetical protein F6K54_29020 [Okeania sp. SIO3B5]|uniref:hypothetical protein n=1 Tax=Okeania sp. SIO3B5 TaxID=2607811 RepID=UPI001400B5B2|nr:hypothetical protein [Okeania sp. SIO3B5]NEO56762.1 hypothetical protein [Okeania sp. SIO3B5]